MSVLGKGRVVGHRISEITAAEPAIGEVEMNLLAEPASRTDAKTISNQQHAPSHACKHALPGERSAVLDQSMDAQCGYKTRRNIDECHSDQRTDQLSVACDPGAHDCQSSPRKTARLTLPASVPSSKLPSVLRTIEPVAKLQINKSFSTKFDDCGSDNFSLRALAAQLMLHLLKLLCRNWASKPVIHMGCSEEDSPSTNGRQRALELAHTNLLFNRSPDFNKIG